MKNFLFKRDKEKMDIEGTKESYIDLCSDDSDMNDNSEEISKKFIPKVFEPLLATVEFCSTTSMSNIDHNVPCTVVDIEILEGNNNDPNNNLDSIRLQGNSNSVPSDDGRKETDIKHLSSPKPGCSKDFNDDNDIYEREAVQYLSSLTPNPYDDFDNECITVSTSDSNSDFDHVNSKYEFYTTDKKIRKEADQICNLLPRFTYKTVYAALHKNWHAENRIELCLWDLLSYYRPFVKVSSKRKFVDDSPSTECKNHSEDNILESSKDIEQKEETVACTEQSSTSSIAEIDLSDEDTTVNDNLSNDVLKSTLNGILCPAKLKINPGSLHTVHVTQSNHSILSPSKLTYVTAPQQKNQTNRETLFIGRYKDKESTNNRGMPLGGNVFLSSSTDLSVTNNSPKGHILYKYMEHLQCKQNAKREQLFGKFGGFNNRMRNKTGESFSHSQFINQPLNISQSVNRKKVSRKMNSGNVNCHNNMASNLNNEKINVRNLQNPSENALTETVSAALHAGVSNVLTVTSNTENVFKSTSENITENSTTSEKLDITLPHVSAKMSVAAVDSNIHLYHCTSNNTAINSAASSNCTALNSAGTTSNNVITEVVLTDVTTSSNFVNSNNVTIVVPDESSVSATVHSMPDTTQVGGARRKKTDRMENVTLSSESQKIYEQLVVIFPLIDENYLKNMCLNASRSDVSDPTQLLHALVEVILQNTDSCPTKKIVRNRNDNFDKQYDYLSGIFPNADSTYLKKVVARMDGSESAINNFIQSQYEHPTYPTKSEKLRRIRITEQQMQYTSKFNVKQFLEIFPDPFKHFEGAKRTCNFSADALNFLRLHFNCFKESTLLKYYSVCKYHLTSTVAMLKTVQPDKIPEQSRYLQGQYISEDIPLLQEWAFITHKAQILEYMNKLKEEEIQTLERLKRNNELLECQCCYDNECMPSKCSTCNDGHIFCNSCVIYGTESKLASGETGISCFVNCDEEFSLSTLQKVLSPTQFSILIGKKQEAEVMAAGLEGLVSCPFCHFASIPPPEDKVFKCLNPECMKESCRSCRMLNHVPLKCYEKESDKARLFLEEKMTDALVRRCYSCGLPFFKEDGCNRISCRCGAMMCYICDQPVTSYNHFNDVRTTNSNLCPLWSDSKLVNTAIVEEVAKKTVKHITEKDPTVKLDAPGPSSNNSPFNNTTISRRVNKITKFDT